MSNKNKNIKGFTIVETLVAITILILAVTGATTAIQSSISSYIFSKDQIVAFYLAQEGFEQIRNMRDENRLKSRHWLYGIASNSSDPCFFGEACTVDPITSSEATQCDAPGSCPLLKQDEATGFYGYNTSWTDTIFRREISLTSVNDDEVSILVTVDWSKGLVTRQFRANAHILNWQ